MKLILQDAVYVECRDIGEICIVPSYVFNEISDFSKSMDAIEVFRKIESIEWWKNQDVVFDYLEISKLTTEEITEKIEAIKSRQQFLSKQYLTAISDFRNYLNKNENFNNEIRSLKYQRTVLEDYLKNKDSIDAKYQKLMI